VSGLERRLETARLPARLAYLAVLALATLSALRLEADPAAALRRASALLDPELSARDVVDGLRNLVLFAGWGLVWMATAGPGPTLRHLRNAVLTGAGASFAVEAAQLFSPVRNASLVDLATNTVGTLAGAVALVLLVRGLARRRDRRSYLGVPAVLFAGGYGLAALGEALVPLFRQGPVAGAWGGPGRRAALTLQAFDWGTLTELPLADALLFAPAGFLAVAALREEGGGPETRRAAWIVAGVGTVLAVGVEAAHAPLGLPVVAGAVVVHAAAVSAGALVAARALGPLTRRLRGAVRARTAAGAYAVVLGFWALRPYLPETDPGAVVAKLGSQWWIPLRFLGMRVDLFSVVDVADAFFLFLPLGGLLAVWPWARRGLATGVVPAVALALTLEAGQTLVRGRTLDATDALVQAAGALVGWIAVRRAGFRPHGAMGPTPPPPAGRSPSP
jgi:VanZ family protein